MTQEAEHFRNLYNRVATELYECNDDKVRAQIMANRALHCLYEIAGMTDTRVGDPKLHAKQFLETYDPKYEDRFQLTLFDQKG